MRTHRGEALRHLGDETPLTLDQYQQQAKVTAVYLGSKSLARAVLGAIGSVDNG